MEIRHAESRDAASLARVHVNAWRSAYKGLLPDEYLARLNYEKRWRWFLEHAGETSPATFVIVESGVVLGFLTVGACRDAALPATTGEIHGIYLAPEHWRHGIGRRVCDFAEALLKTSGYSMAILWVFAGNRAARCFYEAMGFASDGASKIVDIAGGIEAIRYRKPLLDAEHPAAPDGPRPGVQSG